MQNLNGQSFSGYNPEPVGAANSYIRVLHASPDAPPVDVYVNNNPVVRNLAFARLSEYIPLAPGNYNLRVFPAGQQMTPVIDVKITVPQESIHTAAIIGILADITLIPIHEPYMPEIDPYSACVRFGNLSPDVPAVDVAMADGRTLFSNADFGEVTGYTGLGTGIYTLKVKLSGSNQVIFTIPNVFLQGGTFYTIYMLGLVGGTPALKGLVTIDGE